MARCHVPSREECLMAVMPSRDEFIELLRKGETTTSIGASIGKTRQTINRIFSALNIDSVAIRLEEHTKLMNEVKHLYLYKDLDRNEIATKLNISVRVIKEIIYKNKLAELKQSMQVYVPDVDDFVVVNTPKGIFPNYLVNSVGEVINAETRIPYGGHINKYGYKQIILTNSVGQKNFKVHRLVGYSFVEYNGLPIGSPEFFDAVSKLTINHMDTVKLNNSKSNLEWLTNSENVSHAHTVGIKLQDGEANTSAKYSELQITEVCKLLVAGKTNREIVNITNISSATISDIRNLKGWRSVSKKFFNTKPKPLGN